MLSFRTAGYNGYAIKYSPYFDNKVAVATAANFGLVGNGKLFILSIGDDGVIRSENEFLTQDGLFDLAWSEIHENHVATACGDGTVKIFDTTQQNYPIQNWFEHKREVFSVNWNPVEKSTLVTSSWDGTIKIWTPNRPSSLTTLVPQRDNSTILAPKGNIPMSHKERQQPNIQNMPSPTDCIYSAVFSPHNPSTLISSHSSSHVQVWDIRAPRPLQLDIIAHGGFEALTVDWNKYRSTVVASAGVDRSIKIWDLRMIQVLSQPPSTSQSFHNTGPSPLNELLGHEYAIRKIVWSPHSGEMLLSCSYDMSAKVWKDQTDDKARFLTRINHNRGCVGTFGGHREFVIGGDWSLWGNEGWVATTGWDEMVHIWDAKAL